MGEYYADLKRLTESEREAFRNGQVIVLHEGSVEPTFWLACTTREPTWRDPWRRTSKPVLFRPAIFGRQDMLPLSRRLGPTRCPLTSRAVPFEKERIGADQWLPIWVRNEHLARFRFAARFAPGKVVVDCASGDGMSSRLLAKAGAARVYGYDLSRKAVDYARRVNADANTEFEVASAMELPLDDEAADLFVSLETIEAYFDAVDDYLGEITRVLRPNGELICSSTPNRLVYSPGHTLESRPWNPFHVHEYSPDQLERLLGSYFEQVQLLGQSFRSKRRTAAFNRMGRLLPFDLAVRANQASKIPRFAYDKVEHHAVVPLNGARDPECLVAVCPGLGAVIEG